MHGLTIMGNSIKRIEQLLTVLFLCLAWIGLANESFAKNKAIPVAISLGGVSQCALLSNGAVFCWDVFLNNHEIGRSPKVISGLPPLVAVDHGNDISCGLDNDGLTTCWPAVFEDKGKEYSPMEIIPAEKFQGLPALTSLSVGFSHACGIDKGGAVWCFGGNPLGERGVPPDAALKALVANRIEGLPPVSAVSAGVNNTCAVTTQGEVFCWGSDNNQSPGRPFVFESVEPVQIEGLDGATAVENGRNFACAFKPQRTVFCFGSNLMGQLAALEEQLPVRGIMTRVYTQDVLDLSVSFFAGCALPDTGVVWCWGFWNDKELFEPRPKLGLPAAKDVSVGEDRACIISQSDEIWCWGRAYGNGPDGSELNYISDPFRVEIPGN
jgi:alpha-tubulin suppressor-like RCC1 family protein